MPVKPDATYYLEKKQIQRQASNQEIVSVENFQEVLPFTFG